MIQPEFELVLFGGLGDLASRKLLPALYFLQKDGRLGAGHIYLLTRQEIPTDEFISHIKQALTKFLPKDALTEEDWLKFSQRLVCIRLDVTNLQQFNELKHSLADTDSNRAYYLATGSELYVPICQGLKQAGLINEHCKVVLEKPIGHDLESAEHINTAVKEYFEEKQDRKSTRLNSSHVRISYAVFCLKKKKKYRDNI